MPEIIESTEEECGVWVRVGYDELQTRRFAPLEQAKQVLETRMAVELAKAVQASWRTGDSVTISPPELFTANDDARQAMVLGMRAKMRRVPGGGVEMGRGIRSVRVVAPSALYYSEDGESALKDIGIVPDAPDYSMERPIRVERVRAR